MPVAKRPIYGNIFSEFSFLNIVRRFFDRFGHVLSATWAHKLRSCLTMFGIAWGVGSLLLLVGLGEGFRAGTKKRGLCAPC